MADKPIEIGIVFFPGMTQLDVTGPFEVLARLPNACMHLLWKRIEPITSDAEVTEFIARIGATARYVTSVCAGSLILAAAGLLNGYRSTCHWMSRDQLSLMGAIPVDARVVVDRNRISGGGVTAGIDFGFQLAAELCGADVARRFQLMLEYDPQPPFDVTVHNAPPTLIADVRAAAASSSEEGRRASERAAARLAGKTPVVEPA